LLPRRGSEAGCPESGGDFLKYVRHMTRTRFPTNGRPDTRLLHWERYPLRVHVPAQVNQAGLDLAALARSSALIWNSVLAEDFFVFVAAADSADVVFRFATDNPQVNGQVSILEPAGNAFIGDVIPQREEVYIAEDMGVSQRVQEVVLHELGHVLGIAEHSLCREVGYLMYISSSGALDHGPDQAIHPDEQALAFCLRYLPQGVDMEGYIP